MDQARIFLTHFNGPEAYLVFYFVLVGCGIGLPMNSDVTLITASVLAALGMFKLSLLFPIAFFGLLTGDSINYLIARTYGPRILARAPFRWILSPEKFKAAERFIQEKGEKMVFFVRFLPLIRTALYFTAGSLQVRPRTFYLLDSTSTLIYLAVLMNLSYSAGENLEELLEHLKQFQISLLGIAVAAGVVFFLLRRKKDSVQA